MVTSVQKRVYFFQGGMLRIPNVQGGCWKNIALNLQYALQLAATINRHSLFRIESAGAVNHQIALEFGQPWGTTWKHRSPGPSRKTNKNHLVSTCHCAKWVKNSSWNIQTLQQNQRSWSMPTKTEVKSVELCQVENAKKVRFGRGILGTCQALH
jgi:hypothetical protein